MSSSDRHADSVTHAQPGTTTEKAPTAVAPGVAVDNAARAAHAAHERAFAAGGEAEPGAVAPASTAAPSSIVDATARIRALERPSPFGVSQFPPLPVPPDSAR